MYEIAVLNEDKEFIGLRVHETSLEECFIVNVYDNGSIQFLDDATMSIRTLDRISNSIKIKAKKKWGTSWGVE